MGHLPDGMTLNRALRNIGAGMAELALILLALIAFAWIVVWWLSREKPAVPSTTPRTFPTFKRERALEAANRVVKPK